MAALLCCRRRCRAGRVIDDAHRDGIVPFIGVGVAPADGDGGAGFGDGAGRGDAVAPGDGGSEVAGDVRGVAGVGEGGNRSSDRMALGPGQWSGGNRSEGVCFGDGDVVLIRNGEGWVVPVPGSHGDGVRSLVGPGVRAEEFIRPTTDAGDGGGGGRAITPVDGAGVVGGRTGRTRIGQGGDKPAPRGPLRERESGDPSYLKEEFSDIGGAGRGCGVGAGSIIGHGDGGRVVPVIGVGVAAVHRVVAWLVFHDRGGRGHRRAITPVDAGCEVGGVLPG